MGTHTYYCEIRIKQEDVEPGVYSIEAHENPATRWFPKLQGMIRMSERVWKQGPKGGVRIVKSRWPAMWRTGYVTNDEKYMTDFAWVKLSAKPVR